MRLLMTILWPSFLVAIAAEGLFFSLFDPLDLAPGGRHIELPAVAVYSAGFLCFWIFCALASSLSCYLLQAKVDEMSGRQSPF